MTPAAAQNKAFAKFFRLFCVLLLSALSVFGSPSAAQDSSSVADEELDANRIAPVRLDARTIFIVAGTISFPAKARADAIAERIRKAATLDPDVPLVVDLRADVFGWAVYANDARIMAVTEIDAAVEDIRLDAVAELRRSQIETAIKDYRAARTSSAYRLGAKLGILWTALYILFLLGLLLARKYAKASIERRVEALAAKLHSQSGQVVDASSVLAAHRLIMRGTIFVLLLVSTIYYAGRVLDEFAFSRPLAKFILDVVARPIRAFGQSLLDHLPNLMTLLLIFLLARFLLSLVYLFFRNIEVGFVKLRNFDKRWVWPTYRLIRILLIILALFVAFPYIPGSQTAAFQGASILLGVMLTFGSNAISSNFLSGLVVVYKRGVREGDRIQVGDVTGIVEKMSMLDTDVRTFRNELVSIPNSKILVSDVINYSQTAQTSGLMLSVKVGIGYDEDPKLVEELLLAAAAKVKGLRSVPKPYVMYPSLNSHDVTYELCVHALIGEAPNRIRSDLNRTVLLAFNKAGVQIMTPFYTGDPDDKKVPKSVHDKKETAK